MIKRVAFTTLTITQHFTRINAEGVTKAMKISATMASRIKDEGGIAEDFRMRGSEIVQIEVPDPTPSELEARRLARVNHRIEEMVDTGQRAQREMARVMAGPDANSDWYAVFSNSSGIEQQMKGAALLHVGLMAKRILEHPEGEGGGFEALTKTATRNAMRYARFGHHSTSAVSNIAEEMQAAAWAEVAETCGGND